MALVKISGITGVATAFNAGDLIEKETSGGASEKMTREVMFKPRGALVKKNN